MAITMEFDKWVPTEADVQGMVPEGVAVDVGSVTPSPLQITISDSSDDAVNGLKDGMNGGGWNFSRVVP